MAAKKAPLGSGKRFEAIEKMAEYAHEGKARNERKERELQKHVAERAKKRGD
jgi:hypothetical protein